ncbi:hypothetical protein SDRG_13069 [Saprolegnia diclina VS20]|uniref:Uncharacterized protein n=1 Tax=Saprolegnia diclina (strain VS20) TaxID=1156394 RepID=T0Q3M8_SAPDV|nr:hypothetical protein SDRG_13069 [Saprolegnia diclina VS20]EQC29196.1 hypothetical protein SDRG_13069 [Saprolegnia diclina VS20]|eukprot:XP_008617374.1 hypothetical protein SDRG_13069 [Saprolegnia diclina VS20]
MAPWDDAAASSSAPDETSAGACRSQSSTIAMLPSTIASSCDGCNLTNLTVSDSSFEVLKQLQEWNGDKTKYRGYSMDTSVYPDPVACRAIRGSIKLLWKTSAGAEIINACVVPGT